MHRKVAFFGATGGCANACLAETLKNGHRASALVRSPKKLREQLRARDVPEVAIETRLKVVQSGIEDKIAVKETLAIDDETVDTIISGIGGVPRPQPSIWRPLTLDQPWICSEAIETVLDALAQTPRGGRPFVAVISANGVSDEVPRDYPLLLLPLYRWLLRGIYDDKRRMETILTRTESTLDYLIVCPSILTDTPGMGLHAVREGTQEHPPFGYGISRTSVGSWMYTTIIDTEDRSHLFNQRIAITY